MKNRRIILGLLAVAVVILAIAAAALGASPSMRWRLIGSGVRPVKGTQNSLAAAVGQPVAGRVSNDFTIYSGLYLEALAPSPVRHYAHVPAVLNRPCVGMYPTVEVESNNTADLANGFLCPNVVYTGSPNSYGASRDDDWYRFYWSGTGTITIDLDNFLTAGQLLLYRDPSGPYLSREFDQADRHYTVTYTGTGQAGVYYIQVFAPLGHDTNTGNYTLTYQ